MANLQIKDRVRIEVSDLNLDPAPALLTGDIFGEVVATQTDTGTANVRVKILRVLANSKEVATYPPLTGLIVEIDDAQARKIGEDEAEHLAAAEQAERAQRDFDRAHFGDKLVLKTDPDSRQILDYFFQVAGADTDTKPSQFLDEHDIVMLVVTGTDRRAAEAVLDVKIRSIVNPNTKRVKTGDLKLKTGANRLGLAENVKFAVRMEHVSKATTDDELLSCTATTGPDGGPTEHDQVAIYFPAYFIAHYCENDWNRAKEFYHEGKLTFGYGGMNALLEYRDWLTNFILERVRDLAYVKASDERMARTFDDPVVHLGFVNATQPIGWGAPGSTEATSDIDLNTWGDGTEWAAEAFNQLFRSMNGDTESGVVYDVNFYAKDYLPRTDEAFETRGEGEKKFLEPWYDHVIGDPNGDDAVQDRENQIVASYLHMRRYMTALEWTAYCSLVPVQAVPKFSADSKRAEDRFKKNLADLLMVMNGLLRRKKVHTGDGKDEFIKPIAPKSEAEEDILAAIDAVNGAVGNQSVQMAAENRNYEYKLAQVAGNRVDFAIKKFLLQNKQAESAEVDSSYVKLRASVADAVYFANECYATEGSLAQVVAGKQKLSAGVTMDREGKTVKMHNIKYTPHQMVHSLNEQLGDFFKEATRDYTHDIAAEKTVEVAFGNAVVASGKYLHRYFNALKYLYEYSDTRFNEGVAARFQFPDDGDMDGIQLIGNEDFFEAMDAIDQESQGLSIPRPWFTEPRRGDDDVRDFRRACGFGLEMLKKFKPGQATVDYPYNSEGKPQYAHYVDFLAAKLGMDSSELMVGGKLKDKDKIARDVIKKYFAYLDLTGCIDVEDPRGGVVDAVDSLPKLKSVLLFLHAKVTSDYYKAVADGKF